VIVSVMSVLKWLIVFVSKKSKSTPDSPDNSRYRIGPKLRQINASQKIANLAFLRLSESNRFGNKHLKKWYKR
jgi:hypothetical protein